MFARQKLSTFKSSRAAVLELAARYRKLAKEAGEDKKGVSSEQIEEAERLLFVEMCEICLWGNATDLSLLTTLTYEDIQKLQGSEARKAQEKNIIVNDMSAAYDVLRDARKTKGPQEERRVDIVLDNAGFELFVDLILAGYLLSANLATTVVLRPKVIPWFVSDVIPQDFADLINALRDPQAFYTAPDDTGRTYEPLSAAQEEDVDFLFKQWSQFHADGRLVLRPHRFWTSPGSYWRMPHVAPDLFEELKGAEVVLFKGDLNYRKLTSDVRFTLFPDANTRKLTKIDRLLGPLPHPSQQQLDLWAPALASVFSPSGLARRTSSWACRRAKTSAYGTSPTEAVTPVRGNGLGVGSGPWRRFRMGRNETFPPKIMLLRQGLD